MISALAELNGTVWNAAPIFCKPQIAAYLRALTLTGEHAVLADNGDQRAVRSADVASRHSLEATNPAS